MSPPVQPPDAPNPNGPTPDPPGLAVARWLGALMALVLVGLGMAPLAFFARTGGVGWW